MLLLQWRQPHHLNFETELGCQAALQANREVVNEESFQDRAECPSSASTTTRIAGLLWRAVALFSEKRVFWEGVVVICDKSGFLIEVASIKPHPGLKTSFS